MRWNAVQIEHRQAAICRDVATRPGNFDRPFSFRFRGHYKALVKLFIDV
jgi:hypothetical protein